jgi:phosphoglycerate dehydrogenase-like enzyme
MKRTGVRVLTHMPPDRLSRVREVAPEVELVGVPTQGEPDAGISGEVLLTLPWGTPNLATVVERGVRWVHAIGTGVDGFPFAALTGRILTCSRGASAVPISEWVLAMMLAFEKRLPETWITAPPPAWNFAELGTLWRRTLGLVGIGSIGAAVAERALPFGMRVCAVRRTSQPAPLPGVEILASLDDVLACADHLLIALPATARTRRLVGADALSRVKPGVHLINVARGSIVDQDALRVALDDGRVARASLDTVEPEPLPPGHWLYTHPRVRLSPHVSWGMPGAFDLFVDAFAANLRRYLDGEPLLGIVDLAEGY